MILPEKWAEQRVVKVDGLGGLGVMLVGEAPMELEQATGKPFHPQAPAGMVLAKAIKRMGWRRDQFYMTNIVDRRPPKNWLEGAPWEREMIEASRERLDEEIERLKPKAIVTLGGTATRELTGLSGKKLSVNHLRGYVLASRYGIPVVPTFHPNYLAKGQSKLFGLMMNDLMKAVGVANGQVKGPTTDPSIEMECRTGLEALWDLYQQALADPSLMIAYDIETDGSVEEDEDDVLEFSRDGEDGESDSNGDGNDEGLERGKDDRISALDIEKSSIRTVQFAICREWGVSVLWDAGHRELIDKVLQLPNLKVGHNTENFDRPKLLREGSTVNGEEDDTLLMWRAMQADLPGHLQAVAGAFGFPFPWKHMAGTNNEFYGVADVCAIHYIYPKLRQQLERTKLWHGYREMTLGFRRAVIEPMERRGLPVSKVKLDGLREWLTVEVDRMRGEIEELAPSELNKIEVYSNLPQMIKEFVMERHPDYFAPTIKQRKNGSTVEVKSKRKISDLYKEMMDDVDGPFVQTRIEVYHQWSQLVPVKTEKGWKMAWKEPFNPQSSKQMLAYLRFKGYKIPTRFKDGAATTGDKEMERLERETKDPIIKLSREMRVTDKLRSSYTGKVEEDGVARGGWIPGPDGRVRATFTFKSTGQLAASNPNVLTLPVRRRELAAKFRSCIQAEPGHKIVEIDMAAFHAKTTGLEARDLTYMRLANLDIHSYVAGWMVKWPGIETALELPDDELFKVLSEIKAKHKDVRNLQAKPAILGIGFAMSYRRLYFENRDFFVNEIEAKKLLDLIKRLFPKVFKWQEDVLDLADKQGYLQSKWGNRRWFWDVYSWSQRGGQWTKKKGRDAEKAIAFLPATDAHYMLRKKLIDMSVKGWLEKYQLINIVHDALVFHCPTSLVEECIELVKTELESSVMELADPVVAPDGFSCRAEASFGDNWSKQEMKEV